MNLEYILKKEDISKTINEILQNEFNFSNRLFNKLINNKKIYINGNTIDTRLKGNIGDKLTVDFNYFEDNSNIISTKIDLNIVYEDDGLLILNKPAGIAVHPSILHYNNSLSNGIKFYFDSIGLQKKIRPVNRLDLNTSGLIVFAKNEYIQENLIRQMNKNTFQKEYLAIVVGNLPDNKGIIHAPIARKENSIIERCISPFGQDAITEYEVIKRNNYYSLVKCRLLTGRTHQIRVHFAYIGHPLLGDTLYGTISPLIDRQALHSYQISFIHPITQKQITLISQIPNDMSAILKN